MVRLSDRYRQCEYLHCQAEAALAATLLDLTPSFWCKAEITGEVFFYNEGVGEKGQVFRELYRAR